MNKVFFPENAELGAEILNEISSFYRDYLENDMLKIWKSKTKDEEMGGYLTSFDRKWNLTSDEKGAWGQARHIYTFALASQFFAGKEEWLALSKHGVDFFTRKMYDGNGRFNYLVNRSGDKVLEGTTSIFSDAFAVLALSEFIWQSKDETLLPLLKEIYQVFSKNLRDENFSEINPYIHSSNIVHHAVIMIALNSIHNTSKVIDGTEDDLKFCLDLIFNLLYDEKFQVVLEKKMRNGQYADGTNSKILNVGHALESMWFVLEVAKDKKDHEIFQKAKKVVEGVYKILESKGKDLLFAVNFDGKNDIIKTWKYENSFSPTQHVSWTYAEALVLNAFMIYFTGDKKYLKNFIRLHNFTQEHFVDTEFGDWFHALDENLNVINDFKGSTVKTAFHMPRAFLKSIEVLEEKAKEFII